MTTYPFHRRRIKTKKAKVVAFVWGEEFIKFLAALAVLPVGRFWIIVWITPGWFERKAWINSIVQNLLSKMVSAAKNKIHPPKQKRRLLPFLLSLSLFYGLFRVTVLYIYSTNQWSERDPAKTQHGLFLILKNYFHRVSLQ